MSNKSILTVDDSPIVAERLEVILKGSTDTSLLRHAGDYTSALERMTEQAPDIVLLDIHLPGRSGIALLQFIKTHYPSVVVIMITNQADEFYRNICKKMGADYFIDKSKDFEQIPTIISSLPE
ncbi:MAG TPA: response regulator transcription factor [Puia sp.]|nr:response regulator transcription factor [Puia sp.]